MNLLCIDTALASCSACIYDVSSKIVLSSEQQLMARGHAEALPPMVARVMANAGISFSDLSRIAVTTGPGTFTGIRVGLSFARALGLARGIKVLGLNTMVATKVAAAVQNCVVVHQAGMSGLFCFYDTLEIEFLAPEEIVSRLRRNQMVLGTGAATIITQSGRGDLKRSPQHDLPSAAGFAAYASIQPEPAHMPDPLYLREADAKPQKDLLRGLGGLEISPSQDFDLLAKLHAASFETAWNEKDLSEVLAAHGCVALLATSDDGAVGFLIYRAVADEAEILTICVDPSFQRRGAGLKILSTTKLILKSLQISNLFLEVAAGNKEAISLYKRAGFTEAGIRKAYYARKNRDSEDAIIMRVQLN
jgi:tRNA threonylcarbamoyl adenosine modification protein YeaZ/ribosomal-protein-alanine acetyltransferase